MNDSGAGSDPSCLLVIFGASGDLTKRLLVPALYNMKCDGLLPERFALQGVALDALTDLSFREGMSRHIREFSTREPFDPSSWDSLVSRLHYMQGEFDDEDVYRRLGAELDALERRYRTGGNVIFYMATPPSVFGMISRHLKAAGLTRQDRGWRRIIVEKPFGRDLDSAVALNQELLESWREEQLYRIDHYLGKETVQNILAFRFSNGIFEPLWNKNHIDHIQFTVAEAVGVEGRARYYDSAGALRDMIQNHMFQMLAYLCMEPPISFRADAIRNEKAKLLEGVRIWTPDEVRRNTVRGQYGRSEKPEGLAVPGYREEEFVDPASSTETFAALRLEIDNWRWEGMPIYLRSGKRLWKRGTEIVVRFKTPPDVVFRNTPAAHTLDANLLVFLIQPDQGIELRFQAKHPGARMQLQTVNMHFDYGEAFNASRGTGYEVLIHDCMIGNATLFSRSDLVESAWKIAQPILDTWSESPADDFPNYAAGSWGPKAAFDLVERDGRKWIEVINRDVLENVPLFAECNALFLHNLALMLTPFVCRKGDFVVNKGDVGEEMYFISRGRVEVLDGHGERVVELGEGDFFGEISLLMSRQRSASIRALTDCDMFVLRKPDFEKVLRDQPQFSESIRTIAQRRYLEASRTDDGFEA